MKELADMVLMVAALMGLVVLVLAGVCLTLVIRFLLRLLSSPIPSTQTPAKSSEVTALEVPANRLKPILVPPFSEDQPPPKKVPRTPKDVEFPVCEHCGAALSGEVKRGLVVDEGSFHIYACDECGQETAIPTDES